MAQREMETLVKMARRVIVANIRALTDLGQLPYDDNIAYILSKVGARQLQQIEARSPQIKAEDIPLWRNLCEQDFYDLKRCIDDGTLVKRLGLDNLDEIDWRELYWTKQAERESKLAMASNKLRTASSTLDAAKAAKNIVFSDQIIDPRKRKAKATTASSTLMTKARTAASKDAGMFRVGPAIKKSSTVPKIVGSKCSERNPRLAESPLPLSSVKTPAKANSSAPPTKVVPPVADASRSKVVKIDVPAQPNIFMKRKQTVASNPQPLTKVRKTST